MAAQTGDADPERIEALRRRVSELLNDADALDSDGDPRAEEVREEAMLIAAEIEAATDPAQDRMSF